MDEHGYVYGTVPATGEGPVIGLIAHMDTSPDASAADIQARITEPYTGGDILLKLGYIGKYVVVDFLQYVAQRFIRYHQVGLVDMAKAVTLAGNRFPQQPKPAKNPLKPCIHKDPPSFFFQYTRFLRDRKDISQKFYKKQADPKIGL